MAALLLLFCGAAVPPTLACGFHGGLDGSFSAMHPRSLGVAFAIRDAIEGQVIPNSVHEPILPGAPGYWRAVGRLNSLTALLSAAGADQSTAAPAPAISVLFIDSGLWSRIESGPGGLRLEAHTNGAQPGDMVIVTSEAVLAEVLAQRFSIEAALSRAVITIDGEGAGVQSVRALLIKGLNPSSLSALRDAPRPTVRFFGPKR
jgi:hypothetical protein